MKLHGSALVILFALLVVGESMAQTIRVKANVPFDFIVNGSTLSAGEYSIQSFGAIDGKTLMVRNAKLNENATVNSISSQSAAVAKQTCLVFHRYGDRYFLAEVWVAGNDRGHAVPKSHRESELARDYPKFQEVDVVAALR